MKVAFLDKVINRYTVESDDVYILVNYRPGGRAYKELTSKNHATDHEVYIARDEVDICEILKMYCTRSEDLLKQISAKLYDSIRNYRAVIILTVINKDDCQFQVKLISKIAKGRRPADDQAKSRIFYEIEGFTDTMTMRSIKHAYREDTGFSNLSIKAFSEKGDRYVGLPVVYEDEDDYEDTQYFCDDSDRVVK